MKKYIAFSCLSVMVYSASAIAAYRAEFTVKTASYTNPIYISRNAPPLSEIATINLGTYNGWSWTDTEGVIGLGVHLPGNITPNSPKVGDAYISEFGNSGIGYTLNATINGTCSGSAFVDGQQTMDGNQGNRIICTTNEPNGRYSVSLRMTLYKLREYVEPQTIPTSWVAMLLLFNNGYISNDSVRRPEPRIYLNPLHIISNGCEVSDKTINVELGQVSQSSFTGVGSVSPESTTDFNINLNCDSSSPIRIWFDGIPDESQTPGTISLTNANSTQTAKGYGIQVNYQDNPIRLGEVMTITDNNTVNGNVIIPLQASYIQTSNRTDPGKADGTLQFTMQYY